VRCAGPGAVKAPGAWRIGKEESGTFAAVRMESEMRLSLREVPYADWLKKSFRRFSEEVREEVRDAD